MARVLVVDDDASVRRALSGVLTRAGFEVHTADDGARAIEIAAALMPDLVVVDFNMPTNGLVVVRHFKATSGAAVFVAVLTGEDSDASRDACLAAGADAVLAKPLSPSDLRRHLTVAAASLRMLAVA